ncbi:hypothetical protein OHD16_10450 [Sphingobacterium sp. ML3W]|uniref:hypothetical protein n=1 Tax=Sphingobacterium sp. ML3W TaxID=1538644 RepID=UPI00249B83B1|nr:hypothetical protein [Sphingobacterium sp. ML3W]WFA80380.1 hypothetical protein OGI71_03595 [Sphingobacterium sp. ML3W]
MKMIHPLKCPKCNNYRFIKFDETSFENAEQTKKFWFKIPFFICEECETNQSIIPIDIFEKFSNDNFSKIEEGEYDIPLKTVLPKLDSDAKFEEYDHLDFQYDPVDYYIIPGLSREEDDGYLTPVFFDKDLLLYYNGHPDYTVKFTSFSSCNIYKGEEPMFSWGFGINRNGHLFKWLGDLDDDFSEESMKPHLKRFQASSIPSDHEILSKFYLSQNPFSPSDAFQASDNEMRLFSLKNKFNQQIVEKFGSEITKIDIDQLAEYYKPPIMEEREQVFSAFLSLNKYLVENLQEQSLRELLIKAGMSEDELKKDGRKFGSLKLLQITVEKVFSLKGADKMISPLFVLNDLRQLHGHLSGSSFEDRYNSCKKRLDLKIDATDLQVYETLVKKLIEFYENITVEDKF